MADEVGFETPRAEKIDRPKPNLAPKKEAAPLGIPEKKIIDRIDQDGDEDKVLKDIAGNGERREPNNPESDYASKFKEPVANLKKRLAEIDDASKIPEYLGRGSNARAFKMSVDGREYAVKLLTRSTVEEAIKPLEMGIGVEHAAQLVSYSDEDNAIVMDLIPGKPITEFNPDTSPNYTDEEVEALISTIQELNERGLKLDPKQSNTMYSRDSGFTLLDYHINQNGPKPDLGEEMGYVSGIVGAGKVARLTKEQQQDPALVRQNNIDFAANSIGSSLRVLDILKRKFPHLEQQYKSRIKERSERDPDFHRREGFEYILDNPKVAQLDSQFRQEIGIGLPDTTPIQESQPANAYTGESTTVKHEDKEITGTPAEGMDLDPRYQEIKRELEQKWLEANPGKDFLSFEGQNYQLGYVDPKEKQLPTVKPDTIKLFRERYTDDATAYDTKERTRLYDDPNRDPAIKQIEDDILRATNLDSQVQNANRATGIDSHGNIWGRVNARETIHGWDRFIEQYSEKAKAYAERGYEQLKRAFEGKERLRQYREQQQKAEVARPKTIRDEAVFRSFMDNPTNGLNARVWEGVSSAESLTGQQYDAKAKVIRSQMEREFASQHPEVWAKYKLTAEAPTQPPTTENTPRQEESGISQAEVDRQASVETQTYPTTIEAKSVRPETTSKTEALVSSLRAAGIQVEVVTITNASGFTEAIVLPKKEVPVERMIRIYRGVNQLDATLLSQTPYAMRAEDENGSGSVVLGDVRQEVDRLANEPNYQNLLTYVNKVRPHLNERERQRLESDLANIEDGVLKGHSLRTELVYKQIEHNGGSADSGIAPYISASWSPREAMGYTRPDGALLVIDVPVSQLEEFGKDAAETNIKGALDPKNITAIIPRNNMDVSDPQSEQQIATAIQTVSDATNMSVYDTAETQSVRAEQAAITKEKDKKQWEVDVQAIRQKRVGNLVSLFVEVGLDPQTIQQSASESRSDIYTEAKTAIFDYYANRLGKIGRGGRNVADYDYSPESGQRTTFDRSNISDAMLLQLRDLVTRQEQRDQERSQNST